MQWSWVVVYAAIVIGSLPHEVVIKETQNQSWVVHLGRAEAVHAAVGGSTVATMS